MSRQVSYERIIDGRYALYGPIASGGMAHVHFGRLLGTAGFSRIVAIKRLRGEFLEAPEFVSTLLDEARLASRIRHPNVVATLDMVAGDDEVFLVMEYVVGESLSRLLTRCHQRGEPAPLAVAAGILVGVLHALHAAHEAKDEVGEPLGIVHRDVSPQNVLVGADGMARLLDFGVAKGKGRLQVTRAGQLKGKVGYMSPEQILGEEPDRRSDVYAAAVVLWEVLTGERLFPSANTAGDNFSLIPKILELDIEPPSVVRATVPKSLDGIVMRGLNRARDARYDTARDFAVALEDAVQIATSRQIGEWVERMAADELAVRAELLNALERESHEVDKDSQSVVDTTVKRRRRKRLKERGRGDAPRVSDDATVEDAASASGRLAAPADEPSVDEPTREREATGDFRRTRMAGSEASAALADAAKRYREDDPASAIVRVKQAVVAPPHQDEVETVRNVDGDEDIPTAVATTLKSRVEALQRARLAEERGEHAEPETLVYAREQELKGPPGLPGHVTLKREAAAPSSEPVKSAPPSSLPEDMQLPVQSNRGVWLVLIAVVAVALAIALLARG